MIRIAVIGAGIAGLAAAQRLAQTGHRPVLIAPAHAVSNRGDTLSAKALPLIEQLGWGELIDTRHALSNAGRFSVWGDSALRKADDIGGWNLDRAEFERRMRGLLDTAEIEHVTGAVWTLAHHDDSVVLELADGRVMFADAAIDCSGRAALSSGALAERRRLDRLVAAWRVLDLADDAETTAATLIEAVELGWWYMTPMPGRRMMLGLFTDSDLLPAGVAQSGARWAELANGTRAIAPRLESVGLDRIAGEAAPSFSAASSVTVRQIVEGRILRAGDAAAALDPLGANGMTTALWSGVHAADAAIALADDDVSRAADYERDYLQGITHHLVTQQALYASEMRFADAPFWRRRHSLDHHQRKLS